jgi:uncharacterized protein YndB with AHSA1/START domain
MTGSISASARYPHAAIEADDVVPMIHIWRDFRGSPRQLMKAHTDPELFARWIGPDEITTRILHWDARTGGSWRYASVSHGDEHVFHGTFHTVRDDRIVQTFTWEGMPDDVALETLVFEALGDDITRLHATSLCDSFEARDGWLSSGMEIGVNDGYAKIDALLAAGAL